MSQDKKLYGISLEAVVQKRKFDQALNAKEFSVLAGITACPESAFINLDGDTFEKSARRAIVSPTHGSKVGLLLGASNEIPKTASWETESRILPCGGV